MYLKKFEFHTLLYFIKWDSWNSMNGMTKGFFLLSFFLIFLFIFIFYYIILYFFFFFFFFFFI